MVPVLDGGLLRTPRVPKDIQQAGGKWFLKVWGSSDDLAAFVLGRSRGARDQGRASSIKSEFFQEVVRVRNLLREDLLMTQVRAQVPGDEKTDALGLEADEPDNSSWSRQSKRARYREAQAGGQLPLFADVTVQDFEGEAWTMCLLLDSSHNNDRSFWLEFSVGNMCRLWAQLSSDSKASTVALALDDEDSPTESSASAASTSPLKRSAGSLCWREPKKVWCARIALEGTKRKEKQFKPMGEDEMSKESAKEMAERWLASHVESSSSLPLGAP
jgi:hypothetical protein